MGQGHYMAIVFGVRGEDANKMLEHYEEMEQEEIVSWRGKGIRCGYEAEPQWCGIAVAYNDAFLAKQKNCYKFQRETLTLDLENEELREHLAEAQEYWMNKVQPFIESKNLEIEPEILIVSDWD